MSSWYWQRDVAEAVIAGDGVIVAEYFDSGYSRRCHGRTVPMLRPCFLSPAHRAATAKRMLVHSERDDLGTLGRSERLMQFQREGEVAQVVDGELRVPTVG